MSFKQIAQIAGSAMSAQTVRLNTIASNLANAQSAAGSPDATYHARKPVFAALAHQPHQADRYFGLFGQTVMPADFFSPENLGSILGASG